MTVQPVHGHSKVIQSLVRAARKDLLHHTLLFSGSDGIGKSLVATHLAALYFCEEPLESAPFGGCGTCHSCTLLRAGNMPDFFHIRCSEKSESSTEAVKELLWSLRLRPFSGQYRFLVFDDAHLLQGQAANALLKSLEEPKAGTFFILVTGKPHLMLRTIHSRAQRWGFQRLNDEELLSALQEAQETKIDQKVLSLAGGSVEAYKLLREQEDSLEYIESTLLEIAKGNRPKIYELSNTLAKEKEKLSDALVTLNLIGRYHLKQSQDIRWAQFLYEMGEMHYYLLRRNFAPLYIFQTVLAHLAQPSHHQFLHERDQPLDLALAS